MRFGAIYYIYCTQIIILANFKVMLVVGDAGSGSLMNKFFNNANVIMLYEIYFIKHYCFSIINSIIVVWLKLFKLAHGSSIVEAKIQSLTIGVGIIEECHNG